MTRALFAALAMLFCASAVPAQDMPLSQILIDGEGWVSVDAPKRKTDARIAFTASGFRGVRWNTQRNEKAVYFGFPGDRRSPSRYPIPLVEPAGLAFSPDGGTLFVADAGGTAVWAFRMANGEPLTGAPYCPLRLGRGKKSSEAAGLTVDTDGRIYAATPLGIQVFDPTGRMCGVLHAPEAGKMGMLKFEDDRLCVWVGEGKYARKLNASAVK